MRKFSGAVALLILLVMGTIAVAGATDLPTVGAPDSPGTTGQTATTGIFPGPGLGTSTPPSDPPIGDGGNSRGTGTNNTGDPNTIVPPDGNGPNVTPPAGTTGPGPTTNAADARKFQMAMARSCIVGSRQAAPSGIEGILSDLSDTRKATNPNAPAPSETAYKIASVFFMIMATISVVLFVRAFLKEGGADLVVRLLSVEAKAFGLSLSFLALQFAAGEGVFHNAQTGQAGGNIVYAASGVASKVASAFAPSLGLSNVDDPNHSFQIRTPGDAFATGTCMGWKVFAAPINAALQSAVRGGNWLDPIGSVNNFVTGILGAGVSSPLSLVNGLLVELLYGAIALQLFLIKWNAIVFGAIGIVLLGFAAWEITAPWAAGYWKFLLGNFVGTITVTIVTLMVSALLDATELKIFNDMASSDASGAALNQAASGANLGIAFVGSLEMFFVVTFCVGIVIAIPGITGAFLGTAGGLTAGNLLAAGALATGAPFALASGVMKLSGAIKSLAAASKARGNTMSDQNAIGGQTANALPKNSIAKTTKLAPSNPNPIAAPAHDSVSAPLLSTNTSTQGATEGSPSEADRASNPESSRQRARKQNGRAAREKVLDAVAAATDDLSEPLDQSAHLSAENTTTNSDETSRVGDRSTRESVKGANRLDGAPHSNDLTAARSRIDAVENAFSTSEPDDDAPSRDKTPRAQGARLSSGTGNGSTKTPPPANRAPLTEIAREHVARIASGAQSITEKMRRGESLLPADFQTMATTLSGLAQTYEKMSSQLADQPQSATDAMVDGPTGNISSPVSRATGAVSRAPSRGSGAERVERKTISDSLHSVSSGLAALEAIAPYANSAPSLRAPLVAAAQSLASCGANVATGMTATSAATLQAATQQTHAALTAAQSSGAVPQVLTDHLAGVVGELEVQSSYAPMVAASVAQLTSSTPPAVPSFTPPSYIANPLTGRVPASPLSGATTSDAPPMHAGFGSLQEADFEALMSRAFQPHTEAIVGAMSAQTRAMLPRGGSNDEGPQRGAPRTQAADRLTFHRELLARRTTAQRMIETLAPDHHHNAPGVGRIEKI